jgi:hypothetical protein
MVKELSGLQSVMIVGNKKDLLSEYELENVLQKITVDIDLITSAKDDENVADAFIELTSQALK